MPTATMWARHVHKSLSTFAGRRCFSNDWRRVTDWSDAEDFRLIAKEIQYLVVGPSGELEDLESVAVKDQSELPARSPQDSFAKGVLPLKTNKTLRIQSINTFGSVRAGRILEAMDAMAAYSAFKYCLNPARVIPSPYLLVTALVDKIVPRLGEVSPESPWPKRIDPYDNVFFSGFVSWVGKSSLEVMVNVWQKHELVIEAACVFVARDSTTLEASPVNPMKLENYLDEEYFRRGAKNHQLRKQYEKESLFKQPPDAEESEILHQHFLDAVEKRIYQGIEMAEVDKGEGCVFMEETKLSNTVNCHPENRNTHNKIFGGMLMRLASEIAWGTAVMHCKTNPVLLCVDDIWFRLPVDVGSLVQFNSLICYTEDCHMVMRVDARVLDPVTGNKEMTNTFFIMYRTPTKEPVLQVKPKTYADCILFLEGRRHFERMMRFLATSKPGASTVQSRYENV